jgi:thioredoxin reductase (NADPH)
MTETALIWLIGLVLLALALIPSIRRRTGLIRRGVEAKEKAEVYGLGEPVSLHPVIDPAKCAGCGACVRACPEGDVLALVGGQAVAVQPARCVGHGLCERSCPTDAITLVFGTARRGVELPRIQADYETNVPGLYIVGELGGMGLVRNAFEQGRQCLESLAKKAKGEGPPRDGRLDVLIVGGGPAGLSAAANAKRHGLRAVVLEKEESAGGAVRSYPRKKLVLTRPFEIPGYGKLAFTEVAKEELMATWEDLVARVGIEVRGNSLVTAIQPEPGGFAVKTADGAEHRARRVVLAIGRRGVPRKLGVPGESGPNVYYSLLEPQHFAGRRALVVGGGDSAVEAAMMLADQPGTTVRLSYRKDALARVKAANQQRFEAAVAAGKVEPHWNTNPVEVRPDAVVLRDTEGTETTVPTDEVFVFIGGELPTAFLQSVGVALDTHFGTPRQAA